MSTETPTDRRYTKEHEWALEEGGKVVVGITAHAQSELGDIVFVELPEPGTEVEAGQPMGEVESTKSVSDIYSPVSGTVAEKNSEVESNPQIVNEDPYGKGWLVKIDAAGALDGLMSAEEYIAHTREG
ncbi:MAG: glycine cleavage system protein GcvH [Actinomycetota bacterium]